jgi:fructose-1,6-bisphosphatase/inositol monophosphatase family enzyme
MNKEKIKILLIEIGEQVADVCRNLLQEAPVEARIRVHDKSGSDVIYAIDHEVEKCVVQHLAQAGPGAGGIVLVAEGIGENEKSVYPDNMDPEKAALRMIMDPLDGTRGLMYNKRSAFFLAGAAPNKGEATRLSDIEVAVMVEVPTSRALLRDTLWAIRGLGAHGTTLNLVDGTLSDLVPSPSKEKTIEGGFAQISRFFPPGKDVLARIEEEMLETLFPNAQSGHILTFEDQYISSGGQLYELITGKDRFCADLRACLYQQYKSVNKRYGHTCHPYDLAAHLIGGEAGIVITGGNGCPLDAPLETALPIDWIGYANEDIRKQVGPVLHELLIKHGLIQAT